jgi:hypothetical protein
MKLTSQNNQNHFYVCYNNFSVKHGNSHHATSILMALSIKIILWDQPPVGWMEKQFEGLPRAN